MQTILRDLGAISGVQHSCVVRKGEILATTFPEDQKALQATSLDLVRSVTDGLELVDRGFEELTLDLGSRALFATPVEKDFILALFASTETNPQLIRVVMGSAVRQIQRMLDIAAKPEPEPAPKPEPKVEAKPEPKPEPKVEAKPEPRPEPKPEPKPAAPQPPPSKPQAPPAQAARPAPQQPAQAAKPQPAPQQPAKPQPGQPQAAKGGQPQPQPPKGPQAKAPEPAKPQPKPEPPKQEAPPKPADKDAEPLLPKVLALLAERIGPVARVSFKRGTAKWQESHKPTVGNLGELAKILAADLSTEAEKDAFLKAVERLKSE